MRLIHRFWIILRATFICAYRDGLIDIAKGAAFSALLSFFPVLTTLATILVQANAELVSQAIAKFLFEVVPPGTEDVVQYAFTLRGARPNWLIAGAAVLSIWSASDVIVSLMTGFQAAYRCPNTRGFWRQRWIAILLVFSTLLPTIFASLLLVFSGKIESTVLSWFGVMGHEAGLDGVIGFLSRVVSNVIMQAGQNPATEAALVKDLGTAFEQEIPEVARRVLPSEPRASIADDSYTALLQESQMQCVSYSIRGGTREILRGMIARGLGLR